MSACNPTATSSSTPWASRRRASKSRSRENGEVLVRSAAMLKEYHRRPDATAESIDGEGYFHTGDAGIFDGDGHLKIIDRAKDVGKLAGGALFAPNYVENKLKFFSYIKEAVAFGNGREMVCAFINIDMSAVGNWAERRGIPYSGYTDLAGREEVGDLIQECVEKVNAELARDPDPVPFAGAPLPGAAQGARSGRRRAHAHAQGSPRLHRRKIRAR